MQLKFVKYISRVMIPCFVFFVFSFSFAPKAYAADANISVAYGMSMKTPSFAGGNWVNTADTPIVNGSYALPQNYGSPIQGDAVVWTSNATLFYGNVKIYFSYYYQRGHTNNTLATTGDYLNPANWACTYVNDFGNTSSPVGVDSYKELQGTGSSANGMVYAVEASFVGDELHPIKEITIKRPNYDIGFVLNGTTAYQGVMWNINFPSVRVITTAYSAEMEALDKVADEIAAQSDLLLAMKGDLVAILQDIYQMTGDIYQAQQLLNGYVSQMLPYLQSIDQTTTDIYRLLSSQLSILETAINNAATTVESAISAQTAAMIAYLDSLFNTGNEVPDDTYQQQQDAQNILDQLHDLEKPDVNSVVPVIGDYTDVGVSGVLSAIFSSNLIVTMMTLSASFAFGAYVLFGKRD